MKIALISYEYPPDTAIGGIATYSFQIANLLCKRGHRVEVFCGSNSYSKTNTEDGVVVHRLITSNESGFLEKVSQKFLERHNLISFDVVEGPEIRANTRKIIKDSPSIPLIIKLHTPSYLIREINFLPPTIKMRARRFFGALRRGAMPKPFCFPDYNPEVDIERLNTLQADEITTPSRSLGAELIKSWSLPEDKILHLPNPYIPSQSLLDIPINTNTNTINFIGRLEIRKGVLDFAEAIPKILRKYPKAKFRFVGPALPSPQQNYNMQEYLEKKLAPHQQSCEFTGGISPDQIPGILSQSDICVFPSRWENFPNVCLEAMAAARGIVGSSAGGMAEMLDEGRVGELVPPHNPQKIANSVIKLLENPKLRMQIGQAARERVLSEYNLERIGALQEASYRRAIARRQELGPRTS